MAINGIVYAGTQTKWGISEESTFGTVIADAGTFQQFEGPPPSVDYGVISDIEPKFSGSRVRKDYESYYTESGGTRVISFSDMIVRRIDLGHLVYGVFQTMDEGETPAYTKVIAISDSTTQPVFTSDAGYFATLGIYDPISSNMRKFTSCILRSLTLTADLAGDGRLRASGEWISGFSSDTTATLSGTWAYNAQNYYNFNSMSAKQINNVDVVLYGWSVTITNNAVRVGADSSGDAETYSLPLYDITGEITAKYDAATDSLIADAIAGSGRELDLQVGSAGVAGHFGMLIDEAQFQAPTKDYANEQGQAITLPFTAVDATGGNLCTFTISDATDQSWPT